MFDFWSLVFSRGTGDGAKIDDVLQSKIRAGLLKKAGKHSKPPTVDSILMKFPKIDLAFLQIRKVFDKYDKDKSNAIDLNELKYCVKELRVDLSEAEVECIYRECDLDGSKGMEFKEFILTLALIYFLEPNQDEASSLLHGLPDVEVAFKIIADAFLLFDQDGDGYITREDVRHAFGGTLSQSAADRFDEMDFDTDGTCSFKEFIFAFVGWVGTAEEEEDEE